MTHTLASAFSIALFIAAVIHVAEALVVIP